MTTTVTFKGRIACKVFDEEVLKQLLDLGATDIQVTNGVEPKKDGRRKPMSAEHRRKISEARKRLYAKRRATP